MGDAKNTRADDVEAYMPKKKKERQWKKGDRTAQQIADIEGRKGPPALASASNHKPKKKKKDKKKKLHVEDAQAKGDWMDVGARKSNKQHMARAEADGRVRLPPIG